MEIMPREIYEHSVWEIAAYADGRSRANESTKTEAPSDEDFERMLATHKIGTMK